LKRSLYRLPARYAIARLDPGEGWPWWATWSQGLAAVVRTSAECSIVCEDRLVPPSVLAERGYVAFTIEGPIPFGEIGVLAGLTQPLAAAGISVFAISSYDTDYLLVRETAAEEATSAWRRAGYEVRAA
jgi:hypothetical protein